MRNLFCTLYSFFYRNFPATAMTCCVRLQRKKSPDFGTIVETLGVDALPWQVKPLTKKNTARDRTTQGPKKKKRPHCTEPVSLDPGFSHFCLALCLYSVALCNTGNFDIQIFYHWLRWLDVWFGSSFSLVVGCCDASGQRNLPRHVPDEGEQKPAEKSLRKPGPFFFPSSTDCKVQGPRRRQLLRRKAGNNSRCKRSLKARHFLCH